MYEVFVQDMRQVQNMGFEPMFPPVRVRVWPTNTNPAVRYYSLWEVPNIFSPV